MRIISGNLRGKKLHTFSGSSIRPTADRIRESIFNIIGPQDETEFLLDLFSGTGAFGIEALSRGAKFACFIDNSTKSHTILKKNINACRLEDRSRIVNWNIIKNLNCLYNIEKKFDMVFMDPPYERNMLVPALKNLKASKSIDSNTLIIVEHSIKEPLPETLDNFNLTNQRKYGKILVSFLNYML